MPETSGKKCPRPRCHAPKIQCAEGYDDFESCPNWIEANGVTTQDAQAIASESDLAGAASGLDSRSVTLSWSGSALGEDDLAMIAAQRRPRLISLVGPHNAGKTTFLALLYLLLRRGVPFASGRFAGSYSLGGWEKIARFLTWDGDSEPTFPPHTAANEGRRPGLLHLAFRENNGLLTNTLWTDAPGEWFRLWSVNREDPNAEGARWMHRHGDAFLLFADSEALAGETRGEAVERIRLLIERLRVGIGERPVGLVWAKSDSEPPVPDSIHVQIEGDMRRYFVIHEIFSVSVPKDDPVDTAVEKSVTDFLRVLAWALAPQDRRYKPLTLPILRVDDPVFAFRGRE